MRLLALPLLLLASCQVTLVSEPRIVWPVAMDSSIMVGPPDAKPIGWATPVNDVYAITARHVSVASDTLLWRGLGGEIGLAGDPERSEKRDVAMIRVLPKSMSVPYPNVPQSALVGTFSSWTSYASAWPTSGDRLYWWAFLPDRVAVRVQGRYLGVDLDGDIQIDGWSHPGSSGSGIFNSRGEVVAVLSGTSLWAGSLPPILSARESIPILWQHDFYRSTVYGVPVVGGVPK